MKIKYQKGFTLVEIAIVMIIIGLLLGGVLKGQEIITNAKVKNIENSFNGVMAGLYSYQDRYRSIPGDDAKASRWELSADLLGNRDGIVSGDFNSTTNNEESRLLWLHLRNAKLISGSETDQTQPLNNLGGIIGVSTGIKTATNTPVEGVLINWLYIGNTAVPGKIALIIESKLDDEDPHGGDIKAHLQGGGNTGTSYDESELYQLYFAL